VNLVNYKTKQVSKCFLGIRLILTLKYCTEELDAASSLTREVVTLGKMHLNVR